MAQDGLVLTEDQLAALEKANADEEAPGAFDSACPAAAAPRGTFYVGTLKGSGPHLSLGRRSPALSPNRRRIRSLPGSHYPPRGSIAASAEETDQGVLAQPASAQS